MELRLKQELKKGDRTPLVQAKPGVIGLRRYDAPAASPKRAEPAARAVPAARAAPAAPADDTEAGKKKRRRRGGRGRKRAGDTVEPRHGRNHDLPAGALDGAHRRRQFDVPGDAEQVHAELQDAWSIRDEAQPVPPLIYEIVS